MSTPKAMIIRPVTIGSDDSLDEDTDITARRRPRTEQDESEPPKRRSRPVPDWFEEFRPE